MKKALITGITGQDGSYLAEALLAKDYTIVGTTSKEHHSALNLQKVREHITVVTADITNPTVVRSLLTTHTPDEIYNLASVATVARPWDDVTTVAQVAGMAPLYFLEGIRTLCPSTRFFQASSAEMFGEPGNDLQDEHTPLQPRNPYGIAKIFAHQMTAVYRKTHGLYAVSGILFNHESPRRPTQFVTRKITKSLADIQKGLQDSFAVGNLDARRDWGFAGDYVEAVHLMLQQTTPQDYVIATGKTHTVRQLIETAAIAAGLPIHWEGMGVDEVGKDAHGRIIVTVSKEFYRPTETHALCGDIRRIQQNTGWEPKIVFEELVAMMVKADLA